MKTLQKLLTVACMASLGSCTVYETTPTNPPPPPPPVTYDQPTPAPAPAPAPAPVYNNPAPAPAPAPADAYDQQQQQPVTTQTFYDQLAPYGQWVTYGNYGYVWIPSAGPDFVPYSTAGHWVYTESGWFWASDYSWGWAPFHYGRWEYDAYYGWFWIPDTQWAPAWVSWRQCNGYYGWAPLGYGYGWNNYNAYNPPADRWVFVDQRYINSEDIHNHYEPRDRYNGYIGRSTVITNSHYDNTSRATYAAGPGQNDVAMATGAPVTPVRVVPAEGPGAHSYGSGTISAYHPTVASQPVNNNRPAPRPTNVTDIKQVQPPAQRPVITRPEPVQHIQPMQQPAPAQHAQQQPAPVQHTEPIHQQPAPAQNAQQQPAPAQHTQPVHQQPAPAQHNQPAQQKQNNKNNQVKSNKGQKAKPVTPKKEQK